MTVLVVESPEVIPSYIFLHVESNRIFFETPLNSLTNDKSTCFVSTERLKLEKIQLVSLTQMKRDEPVDRQFR